MRQKNQFTNQEKIDLFDKLHDSAKDELNEKAVNEFIDEHYFWEEVMEKVLDIKRNDWILHNKGHQF